MNIPVRTISAADAEIMARTVESRTSVEGRVECHGLTWKSDALLEWEIRHRELGEEVKVDVRIDELDLHVVYVDVPERGVGPFKAISRQPEFTRGLSLFELNRLKKAVKDKELSERIGRLSDKQATMLRIEFYAQLGHGNDPVAQKRLSESRDQLAHLRLQQAGIEVSPQPAPASSPATKPSRRKKKASPRPSAGRPDETKDSAPAAPNSVPVGTETPIPAPAAPPTLPNPTTHPDGCPPNTPQPADPPSSTRKPGDLPRPKYPSLNITRSPT